MKVAMHKVTIFSGGNATITVHTNTARMAYHFANHVFGSVILETEAL